MSYPAPPLFFDGLFPFCVPSLTSAQITTIVQYGMTKADPLGGDPIPVAVNNCLVIESLTLQQAWQFYWGKRSIMAHSSVFGDIPLTFNAPHGKACGSWGANFSTPVSPDPPVDGEVREALQVSVFAGVGLTDPDLGGVQYSPIFYNTDTESYTFCLSITSFSTRTYFGLNGDGDVVGTTIGEIYGTGTSYPLADTAAFTINTFGGRATAFYLAGYSYPAEGPFPPSAFLTNFTDETDFTIG